MIYLSTVTPVYRGAKTLRDLVEQLAALKGELEVQEAPVQLLESVFVDDGSTDGSAEVLIELAERYEWVRVVSLSRNFGQHPATIAGVLHTSGDWVATMDEDVQHKPEDLMSLLQVAVLGRLDIVYAEPTDAVHESGFRDRSSTFYKWLVSKASGNEAVTAFNSFRLIRGTIARAASAAVAHETYFDVALSWFSTRVGTCPVALKDQRFMNEGVSGYSIHGLLSHARRMLQSSDVKAVRLGAVMGFFAMAVAMIAMAFVVIARLYFPETQAASGWASVMVAVLFLGGLTASLIGLVLENLSMLLLHTHGRPTYFEVSRDSDDALRVWFEASSASSS